MLGEVLLLTKHFIRGDIMPLSDIVENSDIARIPNGGDNMSNSNNNNNNNCNCGCIPSDKQCPGLLRLRNPYQRQEKTL